MNFNLLELEFDYTLTYAEVYSRRVELRLTIGFANQTGDFACKKFGHKT